MAAEPNWIRRRDFLRGAAVLPFMSSIAPALSAPRFTDTDYARALVIDGQGFAPDDAAGLEAARTAGLTAISMTVGPVGNQPGAFEAAVERISRVNTMIDTHPGLYLKIERASDLQRAKGSRRTGIIYNFQDTALLEGNVDRVATFKAFGIRVIQLTYNKRNLAGDGCLERSNAGISDFGRSVIARIEQEKLLLDLSHSGERTIAEAIEASTRPLAITQSGCRALTNHPRNVRDKELRALADKGGVFGIYLMPFLRVSGQARAEDVLRHLEHAVNVCGEDHVGIGTDNVLQGTVIDDAQRDANRRSFEERRAAGIAAPGEAPDIFPLVPDYNDSNRFLRLAEDLSRRGWSSPRIEKVIGRNWSRLLALAWS